MLRTERPRIEQGMFASDRPQATAREMLLAVAPPPRTHAYALSGWPNWLVPTYRSGAHRPGTRPLEDER
jgi:hypothetical protein